MINLGNGSVTHSLLCMLGIHLVNGNNFFKYSWDYIGFKNDTAFMNIKETLCRVIVSMS